MQTVINTNTAPNNFLAPPTAVPNRPSPVYLPPQQTGVTQLPPGTFAGQFVNAQSQAGLATLKTSPVPQINQTTQQSTAYLKRSSGFRSGSRISKNQHLASTPSRTASAPKAHFHQPNLIRSL